MKNSLLGCLPEDFVLAGNNAALSIRSSSLWKQYGTVLLFLSTKNEIDTMPLLKASFEDGKSVFLPVVEDGNLEFYGAESPDGPWNTGAFGVREPLRKVHLERKDFPALIFTPGLAFDKQGKRLGHGGGFYDRYLAGLDAAGAEYIACGLSLKSQMLDSVPAEEWDRPVHLLAAGDVLLFIKN